MLVVMDSILLASSPGLDLSNLVTSMQYCIAAWLSSYMYVIDKYVVKKVELGGPGTRYYLRLDWYTITKMSRWC